MKKSKKSQKNIDSTLLTIAYYLLQYLIIRCFLFGFSIQPTISTFIRGLNISQIITSVLGFINYFKLALSAEYIFLMIIIIIPFLFFLLWSCRCILLYAFGAISLIIAIFNYISYLSYKRKVGTNQIVIVKVGQPGTGKSSSGLWQAVEIARKLWRDLRYKYWILFHKIKKLTNKGIDVPLELLNDWKEVKTAYDFYVTNDCVPCLWTNIPVMVNGLYTCVLTRSHIEQRKRIPAFSMLFFDEIGAIVPVDEGRDKPLEISDFFRLCRHFGDWRILCTEQDRENIYIDIRRVVADNEQMLSQKWVLKPLILVLIFQLFKFIFMLKPNRLIFFAPFLIFLQRVIRHIGFRRFQAVNAGNTENAYSPKMRKRSYSLPTMLNCSYDDRLYRCLYGVRNKVITADIFDSLVLPPEINLLRDKLR